MTRGSRKHVLDWTSRPTFAVELLDMLGGIGRLTAASTWMPRGHEAPDEARLESFGPRALPDLGVWQQLRSWWLVHERGANTPNWDIALTCEIEGQPGLVLVEAKANEPELSALGKRTNDAGSAASRTNHARIASALAEACDGLTRSGVPTSIAVSSHYQLANRMAFTWKLGSMGVPTVLVYLGFTGDEGIRDAGAPFVDDTHWKEAFGLYANSIVPASAFERRIECGAAPVWFLLRSRPVIEFSPARKQARLSMTELQRPKEHPVSEAKDPGERSEG